MSTQADNPRVREEIGFIGLGQLGAPMVASLLADGHSLRVFNRTPEKARPLVEQGAVQVGRPEEVVEREGLLMTCLANDEALETMFAEHAELFERLGRGGVHISMSTIAPKTARRLAGRHAEQGGTYVAAPVMGRPDAVAARLQAYLVSGPARALPRARPILASLGRRVFEFGDDPGAAHVAKLAANFLNAAALESMAEAFTLANKNGLEPAAFHAMITESLFTGRIYGSYGQQVLAGQYREPLFRLALGLKDMALVSQLALESRVPMPLAGLVRDRLIAASAHGRDDWDWSALAAEVRDDAGLGS